MNKPTIDLDLSLDRISALLSVLSTLQDGLSPTDRTQITNGEGYIVETLIRESHLARQAFEASHRLQHTTFDRSPS